MKETKLPASEGSRFLSKFQGYPFRSGNRLLLIAYVYIVIALTR